MASNQRLRILYDGTVLRAGCDMNSSRSGVFVVASEILRTLIRIADVDVIASAEALQDVSRYLASDVAFGAAHLISNGKPCMARTYWWLDRHGIPPERRRGILLAAAWLPYRLLRKVFLRAFRWLPELLVGWTEWRMVREYRRHDAFLSPVFKADRLVRKSGLVRHTIVYDALPLLFPELFVNAPQPWVKELFDSFDDTDRCFAISQATKSDLLRFAKGLLPENVKVIPLAAAERFHPCRDAKEIDRVLRKYGVPTGRPYFLSLCSIEPRKNLPFAIRAFAEVAREHPDLLFVLAGGRWNGYSAEMEKALAPLGDLRDRVVFTGYVDDEDLSPLYSGATAFIYLSLYEGFGLPPLEAMQCGCPVLTSNTSSLPEVVGDAALTVAPDDLSEAIAAMTRLADDIGLRKSLKERGIERSRLFSWDRAAEIILSTLSGQGDKLR